MLSPGQRLPGAKVFPNSDDTLTLEGYYQARDDQEAKVVPRSKITWKLRLPGLEAKVSRSDIT